MTDLTMRMKIDRSQAKAATAEHLADMKKSTEAASASAAAQKAGIADVAAATRTATRDERGRFQAIGDTVKATGELGNASGRLGDGFKKLGQDGSASFGKISLSVSAMQVGIEKALQVAATLSKAMEDVAKRYRDLTGSFTGQRDQLAELAAIRGVDADNKFAIQQQKFNQDVGMRPDEGLQFRLGLNNAGMQHRGTKMSNEEFDQFEVQAAQVAVARGVDPGVVGDLAGTLVGAKDRRGLGAGASEDAVGKLNSGMAILGAGKGDNKVLANQFSMLASASLNEKEMEGTFQDSDEVATVVSLFAEKHDAQAAEMAMAAGRGLRDFDGKAKELLKKAGVNARTSWINAIKQLAPVVLKEAQDQGVKVEDVLKENFEDQATRQGIAIGINKGVSGGGFDQRARVAAENQGPKPAMDLIAKSEATERVAQRKADAGVVAAEGEVGAANSRIAILREQAKAELTKEGKIGTTGATILGFTTRALTLGMINPEESAIKDREGVILSRRARQAGIDVSAFDLNASSLTTEGQNKVYNDTMDQIQAKGGNPFADLGPKLDANTKALDANTAAMNAEKNKPPKPDPIVPAPPPVRRPGVPPVPR